MSSGESPLPPGDVPAVPPGHPLWQALDALRARVNSLERALSESASGAYGSGPPPPEEPAAVAIVQDILSIPSSGLDPGELFTLAMDRASRLLAADRIMLFVGEPGGGRLVPRSARGFRREDLGSISVASGEGIVGSVFKERRVLIYTAGDVGQARDAFLDRFPVEAAIAVPVRTEEDVAGVLYAGRRRLGAPFSPNEVLLLLIIADRMGGGLVHQALLDRRAGMVARLEALGTFGQVLSTLPLGEILAQACEVGCRLVDVRGAAVAVVTAAGALEVVAARGLSGATAAGRRVDAREGLTAEALAGDGPIACRDVPAREAPERSFLADGGFRGCLLLPLRLRGLTVGVLYLASGEVRDFSTDEIAAARVLATMTASAIENNRARDELHRALEGVQSRHERSVQVEKARALGELAGGLARELNNVFAIILGKSRLVLARAHDDPLREGLGLIEEAAWRGADVVDRLTALAGPVSGEAIGLVDMAALVEDALAVMRPRWADAPEGQGARIEVVTDLQSGPPVPGNAVALRDVLVNILLNAVDAMPQGGRLHLATRPRAAGVEIAIEDTGEGIPDEARSRVFAPFFSTRSETRLGLGLTVAHGVVTRCGGRIEISSDPGKWTRVMIWLPGPPPVVAVPAAATTMLGTMAAPAREPPAPSRSDDDALRTTGVGGAAVAPTSAPPLPEQRVVAAVPGPGAAGELSRQAASILVIEDEAAVRSLLVAALSQAGHTVETAVDGPSGLAKLEAGRFEVVLTDLALPQRSGLAVARSVKRLSPRTPVVLITGWGHVIDPERLREHGVDLMLVKPFRIERVLSVVGDALRLRASA